MSIDPSLLRLHIFKTCNRDNSTFTFTPHFHRQIHIEYFQALKTKINHNYIPAFRSHRAVNTLLLDYKAFHLMLCNKITVCSQSLTKHINALSGRTDNIGAFAKLRRATISFVMSSCLSMPVCQSVRPQGITRLPLNGFSLNLVCVFRKYVEKIQVSLKYDKKKREFLHEDLSTFMTT